MKRLAPFSVKKLLFKIEEPHGVWDQAFRGDPSQTTETKRFLVRRFNKQHDIFRKSLKGYLFPKEAQNPNLKTRRDFSTLLQPREFIELPRSKTTSISSFLENETQKRSFSNLPSSILFAEEKSGLFGGLASKFKNLISKEENAPTEQIQDTTKATATQETATTQAQTQQQKTTTTATSTTPPKEEAPKGGFFETMGRKAFEQMTGSEMKEMEESLEKGKFDLDDYKIQMKYTTKLGGVGGMLKYIPGTSKFRDSIGQIKDAMDSQTPEINKDIRIIEAMTPQERADPEVLILGTSKAKAKQRIAAQAGCDLQDINRLLHKFMTTKLTYSRIFELKKQGKPIPNSLEDLTEVIKESGGFTKREKELLRKLQK